MGRPLRPKVQAKELQGFKYFDLLAKLSERLHPVGTARDRAGNRAFFFDDYTALVVLYFFNPVLVSMRSLQQASELDKVQKVLGIRRVSLGALSEAAAVFDADLLRGVVQELAGQVMPLERGRDATALAGLTAVDGSVLRALPRMAWALWTDNSHRAVKLHLHFEVLKGVPVDATITPAASSEPEQLHRTLQPDRLYVIDRGYVSYRLFADIVRAGSSFVGRVKDNTAFSVLEERPIEPAARAAGVSRDVVIDRLGTAHHKDELGRPVRLVVVSHKTRAGSSEDLWLLTDRLDLAADLVALAYHQRWTVELFFRWFKCVLGCRHWLTTDPEGVSIQVYVALIASLLTVYWSGCKLNRRTWEMIQFYLMGWATLEELERHFAKQRAAQQRAAEKKASKAAVA